MTFAGSRSWHRVACAIEDAGMIIHPSVFLCWAFGSGFPKAARVKGHEEFAGHRYGLQALKPAVEPIIVWQVPYIGKPVDSIVKHGAGSLNIEAGRIGSEHRHNAPAANAMGGVSLRMSVTGMPQDAEGTECQGRWPPNFVLGDPEAARRLDEQTTHLHAAGNKRHSKEHGAFFGGGKQHTVRLEGPFDSGGASRFFFRSDWNAEVEEGILCADPVRYQAKAARKEREAGLEGMPERTSGELSGGGGARTEKADAYQARKSARRNSHPTVKPIKLCTWLCRLLLLPDAYAPRRILIPFSGSGSEMIAAGLAGWDEIVGIEREAEYAEIARARLRHWLPDAVEVG